MNHTEPGRETTESGTDASATKPYLADDVVTSGQIYAYVLNPTSCEVSSAVRQIVRTLEAKLPEMRDIPQNSRVFVRRATRFLVENGIRQIIDLGSGLPTDTNTHEVAREIAPDTRVVYVDNDAMTEAQARDMLRDETEVHFLAEDIVHPDRILGQIERRGLLDMNRPIGLMMASIIHMISEGQAVQAGFSGTNELVRRYVDALPSGSYLALEHFTDAGQDPKRKEAILGAWPIQFRAPEQILSYFDGLELLPPQQSRTESPELVWSNAWRARRPEQADHSGSWILGGVGYKS